MYFRFYLKQQNNKLMQILKDYLLNFSGERINVNIQKQLYYM